MIQKNAIIIGSGAAGAWAAYGLRELRPLVIDVGYEPKRTYSEKDLTLDKLKKTPAEGLPILMGDNYSSLNNIFCDYLSPKLKTPLMDFLTRKPSEFKLQAENFSLISSFSKGGLGNGWGAGCYRYFEQDLEDFPFEYEDLLPHYNFLTKKIGISGQNDDLKPFYDSDYSLLKEIPLSSSLNSVYQRYLKKRESFNSKGFYWGYPRLAYKNYTNKGLDYYVPHNPAIYTPAFTINELIENKQIEYLNNRWAIDFKEDSGIVQLSVKNLADGKIEIYNTKKLVLALGAVQTGAFVLRSYKDYQTHLPILDNRVTYTPFFDLSLLGKKDLSSGSPMTIVYDKKHLKKRYQISFYNIGGILISDLINNFPVQAQAQMAFAKLILPSMFIAQTFYSDNINTDNYVTLTANNELKINYSKNNSDAIETDLISQMRKINLLSHKSLIQYPAPGNSIHYAGLLPMKNQPNGLYQCDKYGKLNQTQSVYVADAANFAFLPAKNHTFTIMANALRIAEHIKTLSKT